jgi:hypothetical protein
MTLAILPRSRATPFRLPPSPARAKVVAAAAELQHAIDDLYAEARAQAAERERAHRENDAKAKRATLRAETRAATRELRIEVDAKWFWSFVNDALDCMKDLAGEARKQSQNMAAGALELRIDAACKELDRIQQREAAR